MEEVTEKDVPAFFLADAGSLTRGCPQIVGDKETVAASALASINIATGLQFITIIDEWDCFFREDKENQALLGEYIDFLRGLFKGSSADEFVKLAYITGILPIEKYGTQSALNNFRELTMTNPDGIAIYIRFTESEDCGRCKVNTEMFQNDMTTFKSACDVLTLLVHLGAIQPMIAKHKRLLFQMRK